MPVLPIINAADAELKSIYEDLHAHPEIGFQESRTSGIVAQKLKEYGCLLYTSPSPRDATLSRMPSSA